VWLSKGVKATTGKVGSGWSVVLLASGVRGLSSHPVGPLQQGPVLLGDRIGSPPVMMPCEFDDHRFCPDF